MINLPHPPTDNLYKFISIVGLIICILSIYYIDIKSSDLTSEIINLEGESKILKLEQKKLDFSRNELEKQIEIYHKLNDLNEEPLINDSIIVWSKIISGSQLSMEESDEISDLIRRYIHANLDFEKKVLELENKYEMVELKITQKEKIMYWIDILLPAGIILTLFGFIFWFRKSQYYQDKILKSQYDEYQKKYSDN